MTSVDGGVVGEGVVVVDVVVVVGVRTLTGIRRFGILSSQVDSLFKVVPKLLIYFNAVPIRRVGVMTRRSDSTVRPSLSRLTFWSVRLHDY